MTASDGIFTSIVSILVDVMILNNNPPTLFFSLANTATFEEGSTELLPIGKEQIC